MRLLRKVFKNELVRGSGMYLLASSISAFIPFLLLPILTRYLSPAEYGEVAMFTVLVSFLSALCGLSVHGAANRKYFDYIEQKEKLAQYIFMCLVILFISSMTVFLLVLLLLPYITFALELPEAWVILAVPVAALSFITQLRLGQWQVQKEPLKYGSFQVSQAFVNAIVSISLVVILYMGVTGRILGITISSLLFAISAYISLKYSGLIKVSWEPKMAKEALQFGVPLIPHILGLFLITSIDRIVITNQLGLDQAGIYMVAIQLSLAVSLILKAVNQTYIPWLFERLKRDVMSEKKRIIQVTYGYYALLVFGVILGFWIGGDILRLMVGSNYYPAADLIGWVILAKGFHGGYLMVTNYLFYAKKTGVLSSITISTGIMNVILLLIFIHYFDLIGVVWAYCFTKFVQWILTWYIANKHIEMPWFSAFKA